MRKTPYYKYIFYRHRSQDENHELVARLSLVELHKKFRELRKHLVKHNVRTPSGCCNVRKKAYRITVELEIRERKWT